MAIAQYTMDGNLVGVFKTDREASRKTGVPRTSIQNYINKKVKHAGGFMWASYCDLNSIKKTMHCRLEYHEEYPEYAIDDAWEKLCFAIVGQAAEDYLEALREDDEEEIEDLLDFFYSEFVEVTTGLNPDELTYQIEKIHKKETVSL